MLIIFQINWSLELRNFKFDDEQVMSRSFISSFFFYCFQMKSNEDKKIKNKFNKKTCFF